MRFFCRSGCHRWPVGSCGGVRGELGVTISNRLEGGVGLWVSCSGGVDWTAAGSPWVDGHAESCAGQTPRSALRSVSPRRRERCSFDVAVQGMAREWWVENAIYSPGEQGDTR